MKRLLRISILAVVLFSLVFLSNVAVVRAGDGPNYPVTWFTPNDGRIDPQPTDRLAVYFTHVGNTLSVWGIGVGKSGQWLNTFQAQRVLDAGPKGLVLPAAAGGTVRMTMDVLGNCWVTWEGPAGTFLKYMSYEDLEY